MKNSKLNLNEKLIMSREFEKTKVSAYMIYKHRAFVGESSQILQTTILLTTFFLIYSCNVSFPRLILD